MFKSTAVAAMAALILAGAAVAQDPPIPKDTEITKTESGLSYSVLAKGTGKERPGHGAKVKVNYTGWLAATGKMFDKNDGIEFFIGQVIEGWNEGLGYMVKGDKFKLHIPAKLGYGKRGFGASIPPDSDLIFVVELLDFIPGPKYPPVPTFDPNSTMKTDGGLEYVIVAAGTGETCTDEHVITLDFYYWDETGTPKGTSRSGQPLSLNNARPRREPFFTELRKITMKTSGTVIHAKCPPALLAPGGAAAPDTPTTIWHIEVRRAEKPRPAPEFVKPVIENQIVTESGLKYEMLREGNGASPQSDSTCTVHYAGWLTNGSLFDSSYPRGEAATFPLNRVIAGWTEGLQLMKPGAKFRFEIPYQLAYGEKGRPPTIPAKSDLIFVVELIEFQ